MKITKIKRSKGITHQNDENTEWIKDEVGMEASIEETDDLNACQEKLDRELIKWQSKKPPKLHVKPLAKSTKKAGICIDCKKSVKGNYKRCWECNKKFQQKRGDHR